MLLLVPYHGLLFLQNRGDEMLGLDFSVFWLHLWRMGLFFAVSGFLAAMTLGAWGPAKQIRQRLKRIALPLLIAMFTILPLQKAIVVWWFQRNNPGATNPNFEYTFSNLIGLAPNHLWFLSYLLFLNLAAVLIWVGLKYVSPGFNDRVGAGIRRLIQSPLLIPVLAILGSLALFWGGYSKAPGIVASSLIPVPSPFLYYALFFCFGWMLWHNRDLLDRVEGRPWMRTALALPAGVLAFMLISRDIAIPEPLPVQLTILFVSGIATWATLFAVWGFFARLLSGARAWVRYLADAAYWIYLIHIPFLVFFQLGLGRTDLPPLPRVVIATAGSILVSLVTYQLLVRYTPVGTLLHGRRERPRKEDDRGPDTGEMLVPPGAPEPAAAVPGSRLA